MTTIVPTPPAEMRGNVVNSDAVSQSTMPAPRSHYLDWMRAIAVLVVVAYHSILPFARSTWLPPNAEQSDVLLAVVLLFESFGLAVLFLIAGAGVRFALQRRSTGTFIAERAKRLLVPFVVGALVVVPATGYIVGRYLGTVSVSYPAFLMAYPGLLAYFVAQFGLSPALLNNVGLHLWFLAWLFVCSALGLPIFAFLSSRVGRSCVDALARLTRWRGAMLLLALPVALPRLALYALPNTDSTVQGWSLDAYAWYAVLFLLGYLVYSDDRFVAAARRDVGLSLIVAVIGSFALLAADFVHWFSVPQTYGATYFWMVSLYGITGWAWTLTVLGGFLRMRAMQRPLPERAGEISLPTYVLHAPIVFATSVLVIQSPLGIEAKILASALLGVGGSLLVAAALARVPFLRPLLGLRRPRSSVVQQKSAA